MTFREWLKHLYYWLITVPLPREDDHNWVGYAGSGWSKCLVCGRDRYDPNDEVEEVKL